MTVTEWEINIITKDLQNMRFCGNINVYMIVTVVGFVSDFFFLHILSKDKTRMSFEKQKNAYIAFIMSHTYHFLIFAFLVHATSIFQSKGTSKSLPTPVNTWQLSSGTPDVHSAAS